MRCSERAMRGDEEDDEIKYVISLTVRDRVNEDKARKKSDQGSPKPTWLFAFWSFYASF